jgi:hypothetical protein
MASSPQVSALVEAINDAFAKFDPETIVPEFEGFLEHFPEVFDAVRDGWKKVAAKVEDGLPINAAIPEAMRDMVPVIDGQADAAREVYVTFKRIHEKELDQHYNPRPREDAWNVGGGN